MRDQLREAARALLYEMGPYGQQESGDLDRAIATLRAALDAPQAEAAPKAGAGEAVIIRLLTHHYGWSLEPAQEFCVLLAAQEPPRA